MWQPTFSPYAPPHNFPQPPHLYPPMNPQISTANHHIPMIGDEEDNVFPGKFPDQPGLPNIPPTPPSTLPQTGGLDWSLVASTDPDTLAKTNDVEALEAIIQSFIKAQFTQTEAQLMPNPLSAKFFRILQISVNYLLDCQAELQNQTQEYHKLAATLQAKTKKLSAALSSAQESQEVFRGKMENTQKCIVCSHRFKNMEYLDAHMQRRHAALMPAWRSLRIGEMQGYGEMMDLISDLRQQIARLQAQIAEQQVRITEKPSNLSATGVLNAVEEKLLEHRKLEKENQERQERAMAEMIHGLYDSVAQLGDSIRLLSNQPAAIIPQYIPPVQPTTQEELEHSLTSTLASLADPKNHISFEPLEPEKPLSPPKFPRAWLEQEKKDLQKDSSKDLQKDSSKDLQKDSSKDLQKDSSKDLQKDSSKDLQKEPSTTSQKEKQSSKNIIEPKRGSDDLIIKRDREHNELLKQIDGAQMPRKLTKKEEDEELLRLARDFLGRSVNLEDNANKAASIIAIKKDVLDNVDIHLDKLKRYRSYAPLTVPFVNKKLTKNEAHKINHDRLALMIANKIPIDESYYQNLFKEDQPKFPLVPRITYIQEEEAKRIPKGTVSTHPQGIIETEEDKRAKLQGIRKKSYLNFYTRGFAKNIGIPGDSDVSSHVLEDSEFESPSSEPYIVEFERKRKKAQDPNYNSDSSQSLVVSGKPNVLESRKLSKNQSTKKDEIENLGFIEPQDDIIELNVDDVGVKKDSIEIPINISSVNQSNTQSNKQPKKRSNKNEEEEAPIQKLPVISSDSSSDIIDMLQ